jgi:glycosyltransferase involved in cell wall biosynthesis
MLDIIEIRQTFRELGCCVIIATYNNEKTLLSLIRDVEDFTEDIIVVNDGSTDTTKDILAGIQTITTLTHPKNRGKGMALQTGFRHAISKGFRYAITIDSDGQHYPEDIPLFLEQIEKEPDSMIVGARNMDQESVPFTSNFGNRFSVFWYHVETGLRVPDVQTGYRLYPLKWIKDIRHFYTSKYEFELEALVRLAWRGVKVLSVPVRVYYAPKHERVSHFRKFWDSLRTSILNTVLVTAALLWVRPFIWAKGLRQKSLKGYIREYILESKDSNSKIARSVGVGLFMGVLPIWGWQMVASVGVAAIFKLNKFVTLLASNISMPPMLPFILFASYYTGGLVLGADADHMQYSASISLKWVEKNLVQYLLGSLVFGGVFAPSMGFLTFLILSIFRKNPVPENQTKK